MLSFEISRETLGSQMQATLIQSAVIATGNPSAKKFEAALWNFCRLLTNTTKINFPEVDVAEINALRHLWEGRDTASPVDLWEAYLKLDVEISDFWVDSFRKKNAPMLSTWEKPQSQLSSAEQKELEDPDSFLADSESSTKKK